MNLKELELKYILNIELVCFLISLVLLFTLFFIKNDITTIITISYIIWYIFYTFTNNIKFIYITLWLGIVSIIVLKFLLQ